MNIFLLSFGVSTYVYLLNIFFHPDIQIAAYYGAWIFPIFFILLALLTLMGKFVFRLAVVLLLLMTSATLYFGYFYGIPISENIVFSAFETDFGLISELLSVNLFLWILVTTIIPSIIIYQTKLSEVGVVIFVKHFVISITGGLILTTVLSQAVGISLNSKGSIRDPAIPLSLQHFSPVDTLFFLVRGYKSHNAYIKSTLNVDNMSEKYNFSLNNDMKDLNVVFILGETAMGSHWGMNGYSRNTTPRLSSIDNVINFKNARSCDTITARSLPCIFSRMTSDNHSSNLKESSFVSIMKNLGFSVNIFSLQSYHSFYKYLNYDNLVAKYSVINRSKQSFAQDAILLPYVDDIKNKRGKNLISQPLKTDLTSKNIFQAAAQRT